MSENPPGWYKDPAEPTTQRYWDGDGWVGAPLPADATPPAGAPPPMSTPPPASAAPAPIAHSSAGYPPPAPPSSAPPPFAPPPASVDPRLTGAPPVDDEPATGQPGAASRPGHPYPPWVFPGSAGYPPPGAMPPGAFPPGAMPPGAFPPGVAPRGWPPGVPYPGGALVIDIRPHGHVLAPLGRRLVARLIDIAMVLVLSSIANSLLLYQYIRELSPYYTAFRHYITTNDQSALDSLPTNDARASTLSLVITVVLMAVWIAYEVPFIAAGGQTLGKRIMGIRVVPLEGIHPLGVARALRRWSTLGLPTLLWSCGVGFIMQFIASLSPTFNRPLHLAMHDRAAATVVVNAAGPPTDVARPTDSKVDITSGGPS